MLNKVQLIGRLGKNPDLRYASNGMPIANLSVATDESYTDREGKRVDRAEWHRVVVFQRQAENCANFLVKGSLVYVEGSLQTRKWQDQQGQDRYTTEIKAQRVIFLDKKSDKPYQNMDEGGFESKPRQAAEPSRPHDDVEVGPPPSEASSMDDMPF